MMKRQGLSFLSNVRQVDILISTIVLCAVESWWKMVKEALLDNSSGKFITLSLDGEIVKGVVSIDNISGIYSKDMAKEITIKVVASEVKVKLPNGEIKDISEM
jgi:hypothetical protein